MLLLQRSCQCGDVRLVHVEFGRVSGSSSAAAPSTSADTLNVGAMSDQHAREPHLDLDAMEGAESSDLGPSLRDLMDNPDAYPEEMAKVREAMKGLSAAVMPKMDVSGFASMMPKIDMTGFISRVPAIEAPPILTNSTLALATARDLSFDATSVEVFHDSLPAKQLEALTQVVQALTVANEMHERQIDQQSQQLEHQRQQLEEQERSGKSVTRREWIAIGVAVVSLIVAVIAIL